ncbi:MAG: phenylalanine--tRNA ligase subunit beta [Gammaproteobacteria bacterium]|nr:phenylalanine--tRNA ligase subunit beta [Gammaproteobacteria bacterium]MDH3415913.1 phenylalanine--tRNA ligase subunit beta [Gammaproteobacteria bacterium]
MKIAESWLREWVNPDLDTTSLGHRLTMAGHEVDGIEQEGAGLEGVVIAEVLEVEKHPDADRLSVCKVSNGSGDILEVVCGAPNVVKGMKSPLATPGVTLPNGLKLRKSKIRGIVSNGMLCSAVELGLGEESDGIISLADDAPVGQAITDYLNLPDAVIDLDLTPNRGDCFSVLGIARDVSALTGASLKDDSVPPVEATIADVHPVQIDFPEGCPSFAGRVIRNIDPAAKSPLWMAERLRRSGLRPIHPVVDITNYIMLEYGQPLHAYDLQLVTGPIQPRMSAKGENVTLLDEKQIELDANTLVISDDSGAIGLAGIMGGLSTAVSERTTDVFFEAAFWPQDFIAGRARSYGLHTDASLRFERGVDPQGQARAVERATSLLLEISGGEAGPLVLQTADDHLPSRDTIVLRRSRLEKLLGVKIDDETVTDILQRLGLSVAATDEGWSVRAPSFRFDIAIEVDLIEEIARIYGYDAIPETTAVAETPLGAVTESQIEFEQVAATLVARDYQEVISYSFIDTESNTALCGVESELVLGNPISSEMSVMRSTLWPGMLSAAAANASRQQDRIRLFEIGKSFHGALGDHTEVVRIAGLAIGSALPEQWGSKAQSVDFFDIKADVSALLRLAVDELSVEFVAAEHPALQPGQTANIVRGDALVGTVGKLHPRHAKAFDIKRDVYLFELDARVALGSAAPTASPVSRFPSIRRDIAVIVDDGISSHELVNAVASVAPDLISTVRIFDIYKGPGIEAGRKSVALGLILQETSRTLTDDDADATMTAAVRKLEEKFAAELRD